MAQIFQKQPREVVGYDLDMTDYFEDLGEDEISAAPGSIVIEVDAVTSPVLEVGPAGHPEYELVGDPAHQAKIWIGGGLDGTKYKVTALVTTDLGRVEEAEFYIKVKET